MIGAKRKCKLIKLDNRMINTQINSEMHHHLYHGWHKNNLQNSIFHEFYHKSERLCINMVCTWICYSFCSNTINLDYPQWVYQAILIPMNANYSATLSLVPAIKHCLFDL